MDIKDIKSLLHSFYEGETSKEEEKILSDFFETESIPEEMENERRIFRKLYSAQENNAPAHLEGKLNTLIDNLAAKEESHKTSHVALPTGHLSKPVRWAMSIAAGILIILSAGIFAHFENNRNKNEMLVDTYSNPEEAYLETQKTLLLVSGKLNKGIKQIEKVNDIIDKDVQL
ncbi:hypothetical protein CLV62_12739 [Dysgonomonas alginatilytica]|uniref:Uncharacterized protein n=1 Tax=Dysgonomonas alginatilytica TaxID=1605892 RepID=A0A2V3PKQ4_9BACT|nr:hypothetical protein [Dysgonomonas alginatilytica]PXV61040.1 hypothetical protein CLV62_12739 [Dysgonomonas alginatilytica]